MKDNFFKEIPCGAQVKIIRAGKKDLKYISEIASENFSGLKQKKDATKWVTCNFNAFPRMQYFIAICKEVLPKKLQGISCGWKKAGLGRNLCGN